MTAPFDLIRSGQPKIGFEVLFVDRPDLQPGTIGTRGRLTVEVGAGV